MTQEEFRVVCNLKDYMQVRGINQTELAEKLGISQNTVRSYEQNRFSRIDCEIATKMCLFFNVGIGEMFEITPC